MNDGPDEAQTGARPAAGRVTAQQALTALREELDGYQAAMTRKLEVVRGEVSTLRGELSSVTGGDDGALSELVERFTNAHLRPVVEKANANHAALLARVEELERVTADLARTVAEGQPARASVDTGLYDRVAALESLTGGEREPMTAEMFRDLGSLYDRVGVLESAGRPAGEGDVSRMLLRLGALERRISTVGAITDVEPVATVPRVHAMVLELMRRVTSIGKDREANLGQSGGRFKFRGIDAAMDAVGHAMRDVGLTLESEVVSADHRQNPVTSTNDKGQERTVIWTTANVVVQYTFVCPEDGSTHTFQGAGEGRDASDKATSKAMSMALKYALFQALMIPVEGLADSDNESPQVVQERTPQDRPRPPAQERASEPGEGQRKFTQAERAKAALDALNAIGRVPADRRAAELSRIRTKIEDEGLGGYEIDGATLRAHGIATAATVAAYEDTMNQRTGQDF